MLKKKEQKEIKCQTSTSNNLPEKAKQLRRSNLSHIIFSFSSLILNTKTYSKAGPEKKGEKKFNSFFSV